MFLKIFTTLVLSRPFGKGTFEINFTIFFSNYSSFVVFVYALTKERLSKDRLYAILGLSLEFRY